MPIAKEKKKKMAPSVGVVAKEVAKGVGESAEEIAPAAGAVAKEIAKGIKEGIKEDE